MRISVMIKISKNCFKTLFEYQQIFPMVVKYQKMTLKIVEYPRGYSATNEPNCIFPNTYPWTLGNKFSCEIAKFATICILSYIAYII